MTALDNKARVNYTQKSLRWSGIDQHRRSYRGEYPRWADCSGFATWCLWDCSLAYSPKDFANGCAWRYGYTGTLQNFGRKVGRLEPKLVGDLVFYGDQGYGVARHVAVYVGNGKVVSFGSQSGPHLLKWNYRSVNEVRRYIR